MVQKKDEQIATLEQSRERQDTIMLQLTRQLDVSDRIDENLAEGLGMIGLMTIALIGAIIGFNKTRRYKSPPAESETALINSMDGQRSHAVPRIYVRPDSKPASIVLGS